MDNPELLIPLILVPTLFIVLPWIIFHYITKWKSAATLTKEDENLLDELHDLGRRLDERMCTIERILSAENPNWRAVGCDPADLRLGELSSDQLAPVSRSNQPKRRAR
ncbi:envelope stress response membrane protein PspB [Allosphingosinicella sp.]|jgi:phage shock protein B|uniref:envelope stress response membrane protein PspB n=1 Tax=Allosphingosinicella sp. TaxID=2823234 RepID=UPI002EFA4357